MNSKILKSICEKHGNVINATFSIIYEDNNILKKKYYCALCLSEILDKLQETYKIPKLLVEDDTPKKNLLETKTG